MWRWILVGVGVVAVLALAVVVIGALLPPGHVATREAGFGRAAPEVYGVIADVARYAEWRRDVRAVEVLGDAPLRWREDGAQGAITFEIVDAAPPLRLVTRIADPDLPFGGRWIYELTPVDGGTRLAITEEGEVYNPVFRFLSRFVFSQTATIDAYLRDLAHHLAN